MKALRVWFYDPASDSEGFINKIVSVLDRPFCHVEVQFHDNRACSIYMGGTVALRERTFDSPNYVCLTLPCSDVQHTLAAGHAEHMHGAGLVFSTLQMTSCLTWARSPANPRLTFCSKLVTEILQQAGLVADGVDAQVVSPSALHRLLLPQCAGLARRRTVAPMASGLPSMALDFKSTALDFRSVAPRPQR